jgi:hypothetical protein
MRGATEADGTAVGAGAAVEEHALLALGAGGGGASGGAEGAPVEDIFAVPAAHLAVVYENLQRRLAAAEGAREDEGGQATQTTACLTRGAAQGAGSAGNAVGGHFEAGAAGGAGGEHAIGVEGAAEAVGGGHRAIAAGAGAAAVLATEHHAREAGEATCAVAGVALGGTVEADSAVEVGSGDAAGAGQGVWVAGDAVGEHDGTVETLVVEGVVGQGGIGPRVALAARGIQHQVGRATAAHPRSRTGSALGVAQHASPVVRVVGVCAERAVRQAGIAPVGRTSETVGHQAAAVDAPQCQGRVE